MGRPALLLLLIGCAHTPTTPDGGAPPLDGNSGAEAPKRCDPRAFGAKADGQGKDTAALQAAIDACAGGGIVMLSKGTFLSGMIVLKSGVTLHIDADATLRGTQDDADYPSTNPPTNNTQLHNCRKALVYAEGATDVRIEGPGTIDGNGNAPQWIGPNTVHPEATRPMAIYTAMCRNVTIRDLTVKDAAMWGVVNLEADGLQIANLTIDSPLSGNRDGIDVVDCHHVTVEDSTIRSEDDSICLKSGSSFGVEDVTVRRCHVRQSIVANGLKLGTASYGGFRDVTFEDIVVEDVDKAAMAVESVDGADLRNIRFERITVHTAGSPIFVLLGDRGTTPSGAPHKIGSIDGVTFRDVTADGMKYHWASPISGYQAPDGAVYRLSNLTFDRVAITNKGGLTQVPADPPEYHGQYPDPNLWGDLPAFGYYIRHADGVTFARSNVDVTPADARQKALFRDVLHVVGTP
jgi:polygalacturonase